MPAHPKPVREPKPRRVSQQTRRKSKPSKISIDSADRFFSLCVRERADWTCENCGKKYEPEYTDEGLPKNQGLHCSHYYGRSNKAVRWFGPNAFAHCYSCHTYFESFPKLFVDWVEARIGKREADFIHLVSLDTQQAKENYRSRPEIGEWYKGQLERMMKLREGGKMGRIEFESW